MPDKNYLAGLSVYACMRVDFGAGALQHYRLRNRSGGMVVIFVMAVGMATYFLGLSRRHIAAAPPFFLPVTPSRRIGVSAPKVMVAVVIMPVRTDVIAVMIAIPVFHAVIIPIVIFVVPTPLGKSGCGQPYSKQYYQSHPEIFAHNHSPAY